jgi:hypothetical protein
MVRTTTPTDGDSAVIRRVASMHLHVHHEHVGLLLARHRDRLGAVGRRRDDLHAGHRSQQ